MKKFIKIQSQGEIEVEAFTLIGTSSKRDDANKIGYFGSGLKYSIAALLRNNISFEIFSGTTKIEFNIVEKPFRGSVFEMITVNGGDTSLTKTMGGKEWDLPFAPFREIYSNALDEDDDTLMEEATKIEGREAFTTIFIEKTDAIKEFYDNINDYFCSKNPNVLASNEYVSIYPASNNNRIKLFRKGILCYENSKVESLFTYNSKLFTINESRVCDHLWLAQYNVAKGWKMIGDKSLIKDFLNGLAGGNAGKYEHELDFSSALMFNKAWFEVCEKYKFIPAEVVTFCKPSQLEDRIILPKSLLIPLGKQFPDLDIFGLTKDDSSLDFIPETDVSKVLLNKVLDAISILHSTDYKERLKEPVIEYVNFTNKSQRGEAANGKIYLSTKLSIEDVSYIAKIIIEENEHLITNYSDETRQFQDHFIKLYYNSLTSKCHEVHNEGE